MRTYISGDTTCFPSEEVLLKFEQAEEYLKKLDHEIVNPLKLCSAELAPWPVRLEVLSGCDGIFLLDDWLASKESLMEKYYSAVTGKEILFQTRIESEELSSQRVHLIISRIEGAIHEVTGLTLKQYQEGSREEDGFFARMLFSIHCHRDGLDPKSIIHFIRRDRTTILHYLKRYPDELKFNPCFRAVAEKVEQKLNT
jgi:hypothetical protein